MAKNDPSGLRPFAHMWEARAALRKRLLVFEEVLGEARDVALTIEALANANVEANAAGPSGTDLAFAYLAKRMSEAVEDFSDWWEGTRKVTAIVCSNDLNTLAKRASYDAELQARIDGEKAERQRRKATHG